MNVGVMWENNKEWIVGMIVVALLGGLARLMAYASRKKLCRQSSKMDKSHNKILCKMKKEYEDKYQDGIVIQNFNAFIEKYLMNVKCGPFHLSFLENGNLISFVLCVLIGIIGAAVSYNQQRGMDEIVNLFLIALVLGGCMVLCEGFLQGDILRDKTKCYIEDFFENTYPYLKKQQTNEEVLAKQERKEVKNEKNQVGVRKQVTNHKISKSNEDFKPQTAAACEKKVGKKGKVPVRLDAVEMSEEDKELIESFLKEYFGE